MHMKALGINKEYILLLDWLMKNLRFKITAYLSWSFRKSVICFRSSWFSSDSLCTEHVCIMRYVILHILINLTDSKLKHCFFFHVCVKYLLYLSNYFQSVIWDCSIHFPKISISRKDILKDSRLIHMIDRHICISALESIS